MSESKRSETSTIMSVHEHTVNNESDVGILTQEEVNEQIRNYIAPLD